MNARWVLPKRELRSSPHAILTPLSPSSSRRPAEPPRGRVTGWDLTGGSGEPMEITNTEMAAAWEGEADHWVRAADRYDAAAAATWQTFLDQGHVAATDRVLDVGRDLPSPPLGAPGPFGLADTDAAAAMLTEAGYASIAFVPIEAPMQLGRDTEDAWQYVRGMGLYRGLTEGLGETAKADAIANVKQLISDHTTSAGVMVESASWSITAVR